MPATTLYSFPYFLGSDVPAGMDQQRQLAEALDTKLAYAVRRLAYNGNIVSGATSPTPSGLAVPVTALAFTATAGRTYRYRYSVYAYNPTTLTNFSASIRVDGTTAIGRSESGLSVPTGGIGLLTGEVEHTGLSAGAHSVQVVLSAGFNLDAAKNNYLLVEEIIT